LKKKKEETKKNKPQR